MCQSWNSRYLTAIAWSTIVVGFFVFGPLYARSLSPSSVRVVPKLGTLSFRGGSVTWVSSWYLMCHFCHFDLLTFWPFLIQFCFILVEKGREGKPAWGLSSSTFYFLSVFLSTSILFMRALFAIQCRGTLIGRLTVVWDGYGRWWELLDSHEQRLLLEGWLSRCFLSWRNDWRFHLWFWCKLTKWSRLYRFMESPDYSILDSTPPQPVFSTIENNRRCKNSLGLQRSADIAPLVVSARRFYLVLHRHTKLWHQWSTPDRC